MTTLVTIARGNASRIAKPLRTIVRSTDEWRQLWALHAGPESDAPAIDFGTNVVAAVFSGERPTPGYSTEITAANTAGDVVRLIVAEHTPDRGLIAAQVLTFPFHIVTVPRAGGEDVAWGDSGDSNLRTPSPQSPHTATSTGLQPRTAAVLAYLAGPFSGVMMLVAEPSHGDVRFHAWQSILVLGGLGLLVALGYLTAVASLFVSATAVSFIVRLSTVLWIALLVVWAICLWKAYAGGRWKLPFAGEWAERFARR
jgi:uncharacterized membrane protein